MAGDRVRGAAWAMNRSANLLIQQGVIKSVFGNSFNEKTAAYVTGYLLIALAGV